jgi:outer membrane lipase/esterase
MRITITAGTTKSLIAAVLAAPFAFAATSANAQSFGNFYAFGDSLTDCCFLGRLTNRDAPNVADQVPLLIGASFTANTKNNLAIAGAETGQSNAAPFVDGLLGMPTGFLPQVSRFEAEGLTISSRDIASIWIGTNDIAVSAVAPTPAGFFQPLGPRPDVATLSNYMTGNVRAGIDTLVAGGLRNIILVSPYDLSLSRVFGTSYGVADATTLQLASQYSIAYRNQLATLYTPGVNTYFLDTLTLMNRVQADPSLYGFTHFTSTDSCSASASCSAAPLAVQNTYVFNDVTHTTSGFDALMSRYISNVINARDAFSAPGDLGSGAGLAFSGSLLDRLDAQRRNNVPNPVNAQASMPVKASPLSVPLQPDSPFSVFVQATTAVTDRSGGPTTNGPSTSDLNAQYTGVTAGADYRVTRNLTVGGALNYLNTATDLDGLSHTHVELNSYQGGAFASLSYPHFFFDGALTYGFNQVDTRRPGVLDTIYGSPDGNTFTAAARTGYLFDISTLKAGPIAELSYANVRVGSYAERGDSLLTLGVNSQNFNGLTGGAGFQIRTTMPSFAGSFSPFINLTAEHDFLGGVRTITSFSTDAPLLLINTSGGAPMSNVYGKVAGGFDIDVGRGFSGLLTASSTFGRSYGNDYALNGGLKYQF